MRDLPPQCPNRGGFIAWAAMAAVAPGAILTQKVNRATLETARATT
jgi:hypothetical protein